ncbi:stalk domain-containing protein [Paenibacillus oryzisoli]|uniref:stalk domain-containing protein n=1 Tax=Paenibacillus oryzisoli TaxID=1850517 RepID=UPI003D2A9C9C
MKRLLTIFMVLAMLIITTPVSVYAAGETQKLNVVLYSNVSFYVDKQKADDKTLVINYQGTSYLPIRYISEKMGKQINWDEETRSVIVGQRPAQMKKLSLQDIVIGPQKAQSSLNKEIEVTLYPTAFYFDGQLDQQDKSGYFYDGDAYVPLAMLYNGTTYVPVRYVSQKFSQPIGWDHDSKSIYLGEKPEKFEPSSPEYEQISNGIFGVHLDQHYSEIAQKLGEPDLKLWTKSGNGVWWIYNNDYNNFLQIFFDYSGKSNFIYSNAKNFNYYGITKGVDYFEAKKLLDQSDATVYGVDQNGEILVSAISLINKRGMDFAIERLNLSDDDITTLIYGFINAERASRGMPSFLQDASALEKARKKASEFDQEFLEGKFLERKNWAVVDLPFSYLDQFKYWNTNNLVLSPNYSGIGLATSHHRIFMELSRNNAFQDSDSSKYTLPKKAINVLPESPLTPASSNYGVYGIVLNSTPSEVSKILGEPNRKEYSVFDHGEFWVYNQDFNRFIRLLFYNDHLVQINASGSDVPAEMERMNTDGLSVYNFGISSGKNRKQLWNSIANIDTYEKSVEISLKQPLASKALTDDMKNQLIYRQELRLLDHINALREENGLNRLVWNDEASSEASKLSQQWFSKRYTYGNHTDSSELQEIASKQDYSAVLELIEPTSLIEFRSDPLGTDDLEKIVSKNEVSVFSFWSRQKETLLDPDLKEVGIGYGKIDVVGGFTTGLFFK